jgi:glycerol kinase
MTHYVAAIDQGTTSTRCMLFERDGRVAGVAQQEHRQIYPQPGWVEHDPLEIWKATCDVSAAALREAGASERDVAAIGITNQRETLVIWDRRNGRPYTNAIVWQDTRTRELCEQLAASGEEHFRSRTGLPPSTYFSGPKLRWALDAIDGLRADAEAGHALAGTIDCWLLWNLTGGAEGGVHATDVTNASRTLLMNIQSLEWDEELLAELAIPRAMLPRIVPSIQRAGDIATARKGPFGREVPITGVLGDQQAALLGQCCFQDGEAKNTYGTGCFLLWNSGNALVRSRSGLLTTVAYQLDGAPPVYALEGSVAIAGALVQWLRDNLGLIERSSDVEALARSVADNGGVYFVPAFSGLFAPYWRADARGIIAGLTRFAGKGHLARAALEATAYQTHDVIEAMRSDTNERLSHLKVDGGMVRNDLLMQFQADILGLPVVRTAFPETTAFGAACAAGLGTGFYADFDELRKLWRADRTFEPRLPESARSELLAGWKKALEKSLNWVD